MNELVASWDAWLAAAGRSTATRELRRYQLRRFLCDVPAPLEATTDDLAGWLGGHGWDRETLRSHRAMLTTFYRWLVVSGQLAVSPAAMLPPVKPTGPLPRPTPASIVADALATPDVRTRLMVALAARMGLRRGEIARVHADDLERDLVGWSLVVHGKGGKQRRVPVHDDMAFSIQRHAAGGWLFPGADGGHLSPRRVGDLVAGVLPGRWTAHTLRHYFATRTWAACRDLFVVQQLLGHSRPETTQRYVSVGADGLRSAVSWAA